MPAITSPTKILVTGANGFIAVWILRYLLERGYVVRGTIRSVKKGDYLLKQFSDFVGKNQLELVVVGDFLAVSHFLIILGVLAIAHESSINV